MLFCSDPSGMDKLMHFFAGVLISILLGLVLSILMPDSPWLTLLLTVLVVIVVAVGKELIDSHNPDNHFCLWDILWTVTGGVLGSLVPWLEIYLLQKCL